MQVNVKPTEPIASISARNQFGCDDFTVLDVATRWCIDGTSRISPAAGASSMSPFRLQALKRREKLR